MKMKLLIIFFFMIFSVGFFMLIERKVLGYLNNRKGPNKIFFVGLIQFLMDSLKLMFKDNLNLLFFNKFSYYIFILILFLISFFMWFFFPLLLNLFNLKLFLILFLLLMINKIFIFINLIWILNSIYSLISVIRLLILNFSFEILFMLIFFFFFFFLKYFNLILLNKFFFYSLMLFYSFLVFYFWLISILVELNRIPFDYFEGESELISGFNIEFNSFYFMILFLIEYLDMIFFSFLTLFMFMNLNLFYIYFYFLIFFFFFFFFLVRGFLLRYRIDKMFFILWKLMFPLMMNYLIFFLLMIYM